MSRLLAAILLLTCMGCAAQPLNPSFPVTDSEAHAMLAEMRRQPRELARPVVVIGGFLDPDLGPTFYKDLIESISRDALVIRVPVGFCGSFDECRKMVIDAVEKRCPSSDPQWTRSVDVVGLSMGGLVARYAAIPGNTKRLNIARLFTISSPNTGAKAAENWALTPIQKQMRPNSDFIKALAKYDASATYTLYAYVHLNDEVVGDHHAAPQNMNPYWLSNPWPLFPHAAAMTDERIMADISRRLRGETPLAIAPPVPLPS